MTLKRISDAFLNSIVKLEAKIRGYPKFDDVNWKKNNQDIDIADSKYEGSLTFGDVVVLHINDAKKEDEGVYKIEVYNGKGKGQSSYKLNLIRGKILDYQIFKFHCSMYVLEVFCLKKNTIFKFKI